jgi:hypothetical protein
MICSLIITCGLYYWPNTKCPWSVGLLEIFFFCSHLFLVRFDWNKENPLVFDDCARIFAIHPHKSVLVQLCDYVCILPPHFTLYNIWQSGLWTGYFMGGFHRNLFKNNSIWPSLDRKFLKNVYPSQPPIWPQEQIFLWIDFWQNRQKTRKVSIWTFLFHPNRTKNKEVRATNQKPTVLFLTVPSNNPLGY